MVGACLLDGGSSQALALPSLPVRLSGTAMMSKVPVALAHLLLSALPLHWPQKNSAFAVVSAIATALLALPEGRVPHSASRRWTDAVVVAATELSEKGWELTHTVDGRQSHGWACAQTGQVSDKEE